MSFCQYCGKQNPDSSKFCFSCGKPLEAFSPESQPVVPEQNNAPYFEQENATERVQMPYSEPQFQQNYPEQNNPVYNEPGYEPVYQPPMGEPMNASYNEPAFIPTEAKKNKTPIIAACAIVAILLVTAAVLIFTHTICIFHEYSEATCEKAAVCSYCDKEGEAALGHAWKDATCTAPKTCETCGKTEGDVNPHSWNDATCTAPKTCADCNKTEGTELGHDWQGGSCTVAGTCGRCGVKGTEAPGHTEGAWVAEEEATLLEGGYEVKRCEVCDTLLDSRNTSKKDPQVKANSFNFGHYEFAEWIDYEISDMEVDYNYEIDGSYVYYDIWTDDYDEGFFMLEINSAGEVSNIVCWFEDEALAAAFCILAATGIDPNFAQTDAVQEFNSGGDSFTDAGMSVGYFTTDEGYKYAVLIPSSASSENV